MRKSTTILAATLTAVLFSGAAMANDDKPAKKPAAEAASAQPVDDTWITTKVKSSLLADTAVAGTKIDVDTVNGVVYLTGTASTQAQADQAKKVAAGIQGVTKVDTSKLKVMPSGGPPPDWTRRSPARRSYGPTSACRGSPQSTCAA